MAPKIAPKRFEGVLRNVYLERREWEMGTWERGGSGRERKGLKKVEGFVLRI